MQSDPDKRRQGQFALYKRRCHKVGRARWYSTIHHPSLGFISLTVDQTDHNTHSLLETTEGLDKLLNLHYYSRMRFTFNLLPQLNEAAESGGLSRVISVLAAGKENSIFLDDLALKKNYGLRSCLNHAATMNSFAAEELAAANPRTSFIHNEPGLVKTNLARGLGPVLKVVSGALMFVATPWVVPFQESGERHLYEATSNSYPPVSVSEESAVIGSNGVKGSGAYLLSWDGAPCGAASIMEKHRSNDAGKLIWKHTLEVFERVCENKNGKY